MGGGESSLSVCLSRILSSGNRVQITCHSWSAYHVQHDVCHVVQGTAQLFERVEITFVLALFHWLKPCTDEGGEETGVPGANPRRRALENATYQKPESYIPNRHHSVEALVVRDC